MRWVRLPARTASWRTGGEPPERAGHARVDALPRTHAVAVPASLYPSFPQPACGRPGFHLCTIGLRWRPAEPPGPGPAMLDRSAVGPGAWLAFDAAFGRESGRGSGG